MFQRTLLVTSALALFGAASAASTPQGTTITNQATLTYRDALDRARTVDSNIVTVTVRQVYVATVTPDAPETAVPLTRQLATYAGGTRLYPYTLRNDGNGSDAFTVALVPATANDFTPTLRVYRDLDGDGAYTDEVTDPIPLDAAASVDVMVSATIPAGTPVGQVARFALTATSAGNPAVSDTENYAQLTVSADGRLDVTKTVSPAGPAAPGTALTYAVTATVPAGNPVGPVTGVVTVDGTPRSGVLITDTVEELDFSAVTAVVASHGTATAVYSTDGGTTWTATAPSTGVTAVAVLVEGGSGVLLAGDTVQLTYTAAVPATALAGDTVGGSARATFDGNGDGAAAAAETTAPVSVSTTVATVIGGALGPDAYPTAGASGSYTLAGTTIVRSGDTQATGSGVVAGTTVTFRQTLRNTGNASTAFTLALGGVPSTWTCTLRSIDGSGTLGTLSSPVTVAALSDVTFAVTCSVPFSAAGTTDVAIVVTATPEGGTADSTTSTVTAVTAAGLPQLGNGDGDGGTAPTATPVTVGADPGASAPFRLELRNGGPVDEAFTLAGPAGTVFHLDVDGDGVIDPEDTVVTTTPPLTPGQTVQLIAAVPVAAGSATGTSSVTFTATSTTDSARTVGVTDTLRVNAVAGGTLGTPSTLDTLAGGTVTHVHTLTNTGNGPADYSVGALTSPAGFTYAYATTSAGPYTATLSGTLAAGASTAVYVRVTAPDVAASATVTETQTVSVTLTMQDDPSPAVTLGVDDTTRVLSAVGTVNKSALSCEDDTCAVTAAITDGQVSPGETVQYTLQVVNSGTSTLYGAVLSDTVPGSTTFVKLSAGANVLYSTDGGGTWSATAPTALPAGGFLAGLDTNADSVIDDADELAPGTSFTVVFVVKVN